MARRLNNSRDVRRFIADLIRRVEDQALDTKTADCLIRASNALLIALRQDDMETRLERLERIAKGGERR